MRKRRCFFALTFLSLAVLLTSCKALVPSSQQSPEVIPSIPTATPIPIPAPFSTETPTPVEEAPVDVAVPTPTATPQTESSYPVGLSQEGGALGQIWSLADFRYAFHKDRLRLVWEMAEAGATVPHYLVVEVDNAATPFPTGYDPAWGAARIDLWVSDLYAYDFPLGDVLPVILPGNPAAARLGLYPLFDDSLLGFSIGLHSPMQYEVYELTDPVRIVIDVLYP